MVMEKLLSVLYQYIVLIAVIVLLGFSFIKTGAFNDMLLGALIGVMVQLPVGETNKNKTV